MADVVLKGVGKAFGDVQILRQIDLGVRDGEFMVLLGRRAAAAQFVDARDGCIALTVPATFGVVKFSR